jgi:hypothetical protein
MPKQLTQTEEDVDLALFGRRSWRRLDSQFLIVGREENHDPLIRGLFERVAAWVEGGNPKVHSKRLIGVTTRKCANCPVREATTMLAHSAIRAETRFSRSPKATVYRKALFRDRNQPIKQELFTLVPRPDALRVSSSRSIGANSR